MAHFGSLQAQVFSTEPKIEAIKTLRVLADGDFRKLPVIDLQGEARVEVSFDYLGDEQPWLSYRVRHCDANWQPDDQNELDYMEGVMPARVEEVTPSFNTVTTNYYHCSVTFPNNDVRLVASGNYVVEFFDENDADTVLATATFSISEQQAWVQGEVSGITDIDYRKQHQQLALALRWSEQYLPNVNAASELTLVVRQNRRDDTRRTIKQPIRIEPTVAYYEHMQDLIFEGGNNWRQFENTDERYPGIGIEKLRFTHNGYDVWLEEDKCRGSYLLEPDVHGRYLVKAEKVNDPDTESEYSQVHFALRASKALDAAGIWLVGDFAYGQRNETFRMEYDEEAQLYRKTLYLKQGAYNYLYNSSAIEGNYSETPNEYDVFVYYRPFGGRYDRLISIAIVKVSN